MTENVRKRMKEVIMLRNVPESIFFYKTGININFLDSQSNYIDENAIHRFFEFFPSCDANFIFNMHHPQREYVADLEKRVNSLQKTIELLELEIQNCN